MVIEKSFSRFEALVIENSFTSKLSDTYERARQKLKKSEDTSDLDTTDYEGPVRRRRKRVHQYDSSDEEIPMPTTGPSRKKSPFPVALPPVPRLPLPRLPLPVPHPPIASPIHQSISSPPRQMPALETMANNQILNLLEEVKHEVKVNSRIIQKMAKAMSVDQKDSVLPENLKLPATSLTELREVEKILTEEHRDTIASHLGKFGGMNLKDTVRRILCHVLSNELALQLNWCGHGQKEGLCGFKLTVQVICEAVRKNPVLSTSTNKVIEVVVKDWLKHAGDRNGGREKRKKDKENQALHLA